MAKCAAPSCLQPSRSAGYCHPHYMRFRRYGSPLGGRGPTTPRGEARAFLTEIAAKHVGPECLYWPYATTKGYAQISTNGKSGIASRYLCTILHGEPPTSGHEAAHSCGRGNKGCVSGSHISWKTPVENAADRIGHGTHGRGSTNHGAKLKESDVQEIRMLCQRGQSQTDLARRFGVSSKSISKIHLRETWGWLPSPPYQERQI